MPKQTTLPPEPPEHLGPAGRELWIKTLDEYEPSDFKPHALELLAAAGVQLDRAAAARAEIEKKGPVVKDRFGQPKEHPAVGIERNAHLAFLRLARELGLDLDVPEVRGPTRPGTGR